MQNIDIAVPKEKELRLFSVITGLFVASLIISNVASSGKIVALGPLTLPGGAILFPISYIFGDILTEVYGFALSRKIIWTGFACLVLAALTFWIVGVLPGASFWNDQATYDKVLGFVPRIVVASMAAYFLGEFGNSWVLSKMKYWDRGKRGIKQAWRFIASTIVGEGIDSVVFMVIAFTGKLTVSEMITTGGTLYLFKVLYEIIATPISVRFAEWVKRIEGVDHIDYPEYTDYNPFTLATSRK
ncbi:MAG TPA: queuosine precursor transporter [Blastocatellia bacterium]|nr:queuosine precursor transporter [Blastocatellia bacterium]